MKSMKSGHMLFCAGILVAAVLLVATGTGSGGLVLLPVLLCTVMMGGMMWFMMRPGSGDHDDR